jgi:hypothetical protein
MELLPDVFPNEAPALLSDILENESDSQVVLHAGRILSRIATLDNLPGIEELLQKDGRPSTQLAAAHVATTMREKPDVAWIQKRVLPEIWGLLESPTAETVHRAGAAAILDRLVGNFGPDLDPKVIERMDLLMGTETDPWVSTLLEKARNRF